MVRGVTEVTSPKAALGIIREGTLGSIRELWGYWSYFTSWTGTPRYVNTRVCESAHVHAPAHACGDAKIPWVIYTWDLCSWLCICVCVCICVHVCVYIKLNISTRNLKFEVRSLLYPGWHIEGKRNSTLDLDEWEEKNGKICWEKNGMDSGIAKSSFLTWFVKLATGKLPAQAQLQNLQRTLLIYPLVGTTQFNSETPLQWEQT